MGMGDEIMALGRAEALFEKTGKKVAICRVGGYARDHELWHGNPAWDMFSTQKLIECSASRPYIKVWTGRKIIYDMTFTPRAGKIYLTDKEKEFAANAIAKHIGDAKEFAVVAPVLKDTASPNKSWGAENWEAVIHDIPIPVFQLVPYPSAPVIKGAIAVHTPTFRQAAGVVSKAKFVMCNEGGTHHMAASMKTPAVVIFGAFIPPSITGYSFHRNISVETPEGYCGNFDPCKHCEKAMALITPDMVRLEVAELLKGN